MYKLLLCMRYLRTRWIALASILSVMLGVATMVVVNSVMSGFAYEMRTRINGVLADVIIETNNLNGEPDSEYHMQLAQKVAGDYIDSMSSTVELFGLMHFRRGGQWIPRPVTLVGIQPEREARVCPLGVHLDSFKTLSENGEVVRQSLRAAGEPPSWELTAQAAAYRREMKERQQKYFDDWQNDSDEELTAEPLMSQEPPFEGQDPVSDDRAALAESSEADPAHAGPDFENGPNTVIPAGAEVVAAGPGRQAANPFANDVVPAELLSESGTAAAKVDPSAALPGRIYVGAGLVEVMREDPRTGRITIERVVNPGDDVKISTVSAGSPPEPRHFFATVVDVYKSGMSEYDSNLVFCNLEYLQEIRGMIDPDSKKGSVTTLKLRLKDYNDAPQVVKLLRNVFPPHLYHVQTWEDKQGPLLAAVDIEAAILNVLLFLIIAVAGFGILAIFFMIVVEKTRDIGILKALGASSRGVMAIFLSYGLALGIVGSGVGVVLGLIFVRYINEIEAVLAIVLGRKVFDERIYYFPTIPTQVNPFMVFWVAVGAVAIAVLASVLPARRAANLHPVQALRYE